MEQNVNQMIHSVNTPQDLLVAAQSGTMSDHLVRVANLKRIQKAEDWDDAELARQCGRKPQQVFAWFSDTRNIGEKLARSLEDRLGLGRFALDERPGTVKDDTPQIGGVREAPRAAVLQLPVTNRCREMPAIRWADLSLMLESENTGLRQKAPHLATFAPASSKSKFVQMNDDSMLPDIGLGDHLLFDPTEAPRAGDIVLIRLPSQEHFVRVFRPRTAYIFEAEPLNSNHQPLSSRDDGAVVVAVMVEHRRYRR